MKNIEEWNKWISNKRNAKKNTSSIKNLFYSYVWWKPEADMQCQYGIRREEKWMMFLRRNSFIFFSPLKYQDRFHQFCAQSKKSWAHCISQKKCHLTPSKCQNSGLEFSQLVRRFLKAILRKSVNLCEGKCREFRV